MSDEEGQKWPQRRCQGPNSTAGAPNGKSGFNFAVNLLAGILAYCLFSKKPSLPIRSLKALALQQPVGDSQVAGGPRGDACVHTAEVGRVIAAAAGGNWLVAACGGHHHQQDVGSVRPGAFQLELFLLLSAAQVHRYHHLALLFPR